MSKVYKMLSDLESNYGIAFGGSDDSDSDSSSDSSYSTNSKSKSSATSSTKSKSGVTGPSYLKSVENNNHTNIHTTGQKDEKLEYDISDNVKEVSAAAAEGCVKGAITGFGLSGGNLPAAGAGCVIGACVDGGIEAAKRL